MSRITAPATKLSRTLLESQRTAGAALMPKYDELLRQRRSTRSPEQTETRGLTTTHRPTPQPSIANRPKPLMQTFHSSAPSRSPAGNLDTTVLPALHSTGIAAEPMPRMPLLPDNYNAFHAEAETTEPTAAHATIVAANPDAVVPGAPLANVQGPTVDGVELKFAHEQPQPRDESSMIGDIWRGMVEDVMGGPRAKPSV